MAYIPFDASSPDGATQNGAAVTSVIRTNQAALRDGLVTLTFRGWSLNVNGADKTAPSAWVYSKGSESIKALPTYLTTGVASGMISRMLYTYSSDGFVSEVTIGAKNLSYDASAIFVSSYWS